jgi:large subunit ribosomal protein L23
MAYLEDVLIEPMVSEKNWKLQESRKYVFRVHPQANKVQIKRAVESLFKVRVTKVWVMNWLGKPRRRKYWQQGRTENWKKAIVQLAKDDRIEIYQ